MWTHSERTPLIEGGPSNGNSVHSDINRSFSQRTAALLEGEGEPSWLESYRYFWLGDWWLGGWWLGGWSNILLIFVPLSFISHHLNWDAALRFSFSFMATMLLAKLLGTAPEQILMPMELGQTLSGLLNASFGNAVKIIVGVAALLQDELRIVQTSMLGSILFYLLLVLGCSFFAGGLKYRESGFQVTAAQAASSLMTLACLTLVIPAAYNFSFKDSPGSTQEGLLVISRCTALLLLGIYIAYLLFQLKTHNTLFLAPQAWGEEEEEEEEEEEVARMSVVAAGLLIVTVITSFCASYLVASVEETATRYHISKTFISIILIPIAANAAEHVTSIWMATKDKMQLTIGICIGNSIQIASFVIPLLVVVGWITGHELTLFFADFETIVLFVSVMLVNPLVQNGKSNYMAGLMLITLYLVVAISLWVSG
ncbi:calcium/proton exchanger [Athelia psychrophila]|uniref:Vacuolar calcium ion transporter n=1 Tax=Athelia psychrophila TaxID=1759441 RepID=A0A166GYF1_9AGAM|nr:calcium/proton exchanger [Fibularhizoctonia sp. CBS 109695]